MSITLRLLAASNLTYAMGPQAPYDGIASLNSPQFFASGVGRINAALVATADFGVVVAFRGTLPPIAGKPPLQVIRDWVQDAEVELELGDKLPGQVHHGFLGALDSLWQDVSTAVCAQLKGSRVQKLYVTGHSKGGAMAHLAAARFAMSGIVSGDAIAVSTFEGAMPGNGDFASSYARLVPDATRYEFQDDLVPHLPPSIAGRELLRGLPGLEDVVKLTDDYSYDHAGTLAFIDGSGSFVGDSPILRLQRNWQLGEKLVSPGGVVDVIKDHAIDTGSGVWTAIAGNAELP